MREWIDRRIGRSDSDPDRPGRRVGWRDGRGWAFLEDTWVLFLEDAWVLVEPQAMFVSAAWGDSNIVCDWFRVPPELLAAFRAGEDWRPVVDWLAEAYPDRLGWLAEGVAA